VGEEPYAGEDGGSGHTYLFQLTHFDPIHCKTTIKQPHLICESLYATSKDGFHIDGMDGITVVDDQITEILPQLVIGFASDGFEVMVVHHTDKLDSGFVIMVDLDK
jgi:hypothetical protein